MTVKCVSCGTALRNRLDTYGDVGSEMCETCWYVFLDDLDEAGEIEHYGLAPHHHDMSITGSIFGSTVHDSLPETSTDGWYWIEDRQAWFRPDSENPGSGVWRYKHPLLTVAMPIAP